MPDYEFIGKAKLPRGFSFPVKRSELDRFLDTHDIQLVSGVSLGGPESDCRVLWADYSGPRRQSQHASLTLWFNAVPSTLRKSVMEQIITDVLPTLATWIVGLSDDSLATNQIDHRLDVCYQSTDDPNHCTLELTVDAPIERLRHSRYRADVRAN